MKDKLKSYKRKRNFTKTPEPKAKLGKKSKKLSFVVQHHIARKDHYDLRLEWNGTLKSWAVPKGPSLSSKDKRLAIQVEDHPIDYKNFEGTIPKGEYGGGTVMIWDTGTWTPLIENPNFHDGFIKFKLNGKRLKGSWMLTYFKENNWLLIKEKDKYEKNIGISKYKKSIKTNRTMKEIENNIQKTKFKEKQELDNIEITNPDKVIFTNPKVTKIEIVNYYKEISKKMLPYIENRLISVVRCPRGTSNQCFYKKHLETRSKGIGKINIPNDNQNKKDYYYIKNIKSLIEEVQMNSFEFHIWGSKIDDINKPNTIVFDLDPDEKMSLKKVREGAKDLKSILDKLKLKSFIKTSGGKGYHIIVPINSKISWREARKIAKSVALIMQTTWPEKYVANMRKKERKNKIYVDWVRNTKGATSVAPYSIRIRKKPTISMPISWKDLDKIKPNEVTIKNYKKYLKNTNPWKNFFNVN